MYNAFVGRDMVATVPFEIYHQCTVRTHSTYDTSLHVSYISLYSVYSFSILSAHLCILSLHISVHSHLCIFDTINFHTPCMLICVYCRTGNNAAPQSVGLLHGPHRLQPHATGNKHGCRARVRRVWPETETPIGTFGGQCPLPAILQVSHNVKTCDLVLHVGIMWASCEHHVSIMLTSCGRHVDIMWASCEHHVGVMLTSCGRDVDIMWASLWGSCEPCFIDHAFYVAVTAICTMLWNVCDAIMPDTVHV